MPSNENDRDSLLFNGPLPLKDDQTLFPTRITCDREVEENQLQCPCHCLRRQERRTKNKAAAAAAALPSDTAKGLSPWDTAASAPTPQATAWSQRRSGYSFRHGFSHK